MNYQILAIAGLGAGEIVLIIVAILILFGGRKIPELMRGLGKGMREFKDASNGKNEETTSSKETTK